MRDFKKRGGGGFNRRDDRRGGGGGGRRDDRRGGGGGDFNRRDDRSFDKQMHPAVCADCGDDCEIPFKPRTDKPVYCSNCFQKDDKPSFSRDSRSDSRGGGRDFGSSRDQGKKSDHGKQDFVELNKKLDKIISMIEAAQAKHHKVSEVKAEKAPDKEEKAVVKKAVKKVAAKKVEKKAVAKKVVKKVAKKKVAKKK